MRHHRFSSEFHHLWFHSQRPAPGWIIRPLKLCSLLRDDLLQLCHRLVDAAVDWSHPMWLMEWDTSLAQPLFLLFVLVLRMTGCEQRPSTFTDFASVNLRASRFENVWPWTAFRDIFCQTGVVFDVALFLFRRAMGNLMSRVQDGTAEQDANASQRRAAGWVSGLIYLMNSITVLVCTCTKSTFKVFVLKCWRNKISQRWRSRVLLTKNM